MEWMQWTEMEWNGMEGHGMNGMVCVEWNVKERIGMDWIGLEWNGIMCSKWMLDPSKEEPQGLRNQSRRLPERFKFALGSTVNNKLGWQEASRTL